MPHRLASRRVWIFDLDNTLYPPEIRLFDQIERRMTAYVARALDVAPSEADRLRRHYWARYGTTLAGLMAEHGLDPDPYLDDVHDIGFEVLTPDPELRASIEALPGRRIVHTNGSAPYARRVITARGLDGLFEQVFGVEDADYHPKPHPEAFNAIAAKAGLDAPEAVMIEDDARNLAVPHAQGMATVHVTGIGAPVDDAPHIHYRTADLTTFLQAVLSR